MVRKPGRDAFLHSGIPVRGGRVGNTENQVMDMRFTPCSILRSLLEAGHAAARNAFPGHVVLLAPADSIFGNPITIGTFYE